MILFRVDATARLGSGHFMRCLALAQAAQRSGEKVAFATAGPIAQLQREPAIETVKIDAEPGSAADARETTAALHKHEAEWLVLDGYYFGADYQDAIKSGGHRLLVIDDHGTAGRYSAELVLDQNLDASSEPYAARQDSTRLLLGSRFVLLREEFASWRGWRRETSDQARRVLVTFGGSDPVNATARVLAALADFPGVEFVVVIGPQFSAPLPDLPNVRIERNVTEMPRLIAECDIALTAAGSTCWELAFLQTPMLLLPIAENQRPIAEALERHGAAVHLGWHADLAPDRIATAVRALLDDPDRRRAMAAAGRRLVDGEGAARVLAHLLKTRLHLRPALAEDCRRVWEWSNEPAVRAASFRSEPIPWDEHCRWFAARLEDEHCRFYIAANDGPVGQVRFALAGDGAAVISASVDAALRGRGLGGALILAACERFFSETRAVRVRALIKPENTASFQAFDHAGFRRVEDTVEAGLPAAQFILEREAA
jgi:UDP-2,4-diacetamido-2,4,6-trideoxy-beta-L-altropyranose hydrolase